MSRPSKTGHKIPRMHGGITLTQCITPTIEQESQFYAIPMPTEQQMALVISALRMHTIIMHAGEYDFSELGNPDKVTEHWPMQSSIGRFFRDAARETLDNVTENNLGNPVPNTNVEDEELGRAVAKIVRDAIGALNHTHIGYSSEHDYMADPYVDDILQLIAARERKAVEETDKYTWDSWPIGWGDDEKHRRQLILIKSGKVVKQEVLVDGEFCRCKYPHGWPTVEACIESWAKNSIAELTSTKDKS